MPKVRGKDISSFKDREDTSLRQKYSLLLSLISALDLGFSILVVLRFSRAGSTRTSDLNIHRRS